MHVAVERLSREQALARWAELCEDPELAKLEALFEMDEFGEPYMTPPPSLRHQLISDALAQQLREPLGGKAIVECPVYAGKTYLADIAWMPDEQIRGEPPAAAVAPPLVVEVLSRGNTPQGIAAKTQAYLAHGVREVVLVELDGCIHYFSVDGERPVSQFGIRLKLPA
jgi:Uma2 family endonuclease